MASSGLMASARWSYLGIWGVSAALVALSWVGACGPRGEAPALRLGTNGWIGYEPLHAFAAAGRLDSFLQLVEYVSATQVMRGFENGDIDAAALTLDEALRLSANTRDVRLVAIVDWSAGGDALVAREDRPTLASLAGARVGVERTALGALVLTRVLERAGLQADQVVPVSLNANEHLQAWEQGTVDAVITFEPTVTQLQARGGVVLFSSLEIPGEIVDVLVVRASLLAGRPALLSELRGWWFAARDWAQASPEDFGALAAARFHQDPKVLAAQLEKVHLPARAEEERAFAGLTELAKKYAQLMRARSIAEVSDADVARLLGAAP